MIFWDSSAIIPLLIAEERSRSVRSLLRDDPSIAAWWATIVECRSALSRVERLELLPRAALSKAGRRLDELHAAWTEVAPSAEVRERAMHLVLRHPLRAADALQLGAALTWARGRPRGHRFVSLDARLSDAARGEGFDLAEADGS